MYTQCPNCETVFRLSAEVLRAAAGQVRCGRCGEVFNALSRLAEQADAFTAGESALELEARADRILASPATEAAADPEAYGAPESIGAQAAIDETQDEQIAQLRIEGDAPSEAEDAAALEFTLPPGELDRIFVGAAYRPLLEPQLAPPPPAPAAPQPAPTPAPLELDELRPPRRRFAALLIAVAVLLALTLGAQIVNRNREVIAASPSFGGALRHIYARLGDPLPLPANLSAYQLRQWGVTGEPGANGALRVRASILNAARQFQPYPLLRVTLTDRFGNRVGAREFEASEYLPKPPSAPMPPGMRADATINIIDPGKNAVGFEIDICMRRAAGDVVCADDAAAHPR
ncbi:MAG TPA: DUF3426 domain-containing protein [Steroidobacteraceae bacterium]|nr:DUF3426 domain-containing protein [Steroidobacteraceae bacterium]